MSDDESKLGTPDPPVADAGEQTPTSETEGTDDRGGLSAEDTEKLHLVWKAKAEKLEALEAELAEVKKRLEPPPAAPQATDDDESWKDEVRSYAKDRTDANGNVIKGDAVAKGLVKQWDRDERRERAAFLKDQLDEIEDRAYRKRVLDHYVKNHHRLVDINSADTELRKADLEAENKKLRDELKRQAERNDPNVVRTDAREVPASQAKIREMTMAQWKREQEELPDDQRMAQQLALRRGLIKRKD